MLGERAAIEHLNTMGLIDKTDTDQRYTIFRKFGQASLAPSLDIHMQAALRKQQAFEEWAQNTDAQQQSFVLAQQDMAQYQQQLQTAADPAQPIPTFDINKRTPLAWKPWFRPDVHKQEFLKWMNGDKMMQLLTENPKLEELCTAHLQQIDLALAPPMPMPAGRQRSGRTETGWWVGPSDEEQQLGISRVAKCGGSHGATTAVTG
jgi:hypothetical protein